MGPKPRRVVRLACQAASRPSYGHAFPRGTDVPRNAQTGFSWQGAAELFSPLCKKPASENAIHPLAQAKGLSGGEAVSAAVALVLCSSKAVDKTTTKVAVWWWWGWTPPDPGL